MDLARIAPYGLRLIINGLDFVDAPTLGDVLANSLVIRHQVWQSTLVCPDCLLVGWVYGYQGAAV